MGFSIVQILGTDAAVALAKTKVSEATAKKKVRTLTEQGDRDFVRTTRINKNGTVSNYGT